VTVVLETETDPRAAFDAVVEELVAALERAGLAVEPGPEGRVREGGSEVGVVTAWEAPNRALLEWRAADWDHDDRTELELRCERISDKTHITLEHRGFGRQFWAEHELVGWFADEVAAPFLVHSSPRRYGDWLTNRAARRPFGGFARASYADPTHHKPSFGAVLAALGLQPDDVLLELGPGGGAFLHEALRHCARAVAIDHSEEMVQLAQETNADAVAAGRLEVLQGDAHDLPFADASFTCAAAMQVFFFFADPQRVLAECHRVLRPGGRLAVFTVAEGAKGTPAAPEPMASRGHFYSDDELVRLARSAGFGEARVDHPDLEPHARAAGLPDDVVAMFKGGRELSQLLVARSS